MRGGEGSNRLSTLSLTGFSRNDDSELNKLLLKTCQDFLGSNAEARTVSAVSGVTAADLILLRSQLNAKISPSFKRDFKNDHS